MSTMTPLEAEHILDIVSAALQEEGELSVYLLSALHGYDVFQIDVALKLRLANEMLVLARRDEFEEKFTEGIKLYSAIPMQVLSLFVPDEKMAELKKLPRGSTEFVIETSRLMTAWLDYSTPPTIKDKRFADLETIESFGDYCKHVGAEDPLYWQKIYTRIGLEYTSTCPKGNYPASVCW